MVAGVSAAGVAGAIFISARAGAVAAAAAAEVPKFGVAVLGGGAANVVCGTGAAEKLRAGAACGATAGAANAALPRVAPELLIVAVAPLRNSASSSSIGANRCALISRNKPISRCT